MSSLNVTAGNGENHELHRVLKDRFGFGEFRPMQEEIIRDSLAGRDVVALLPTGAGKSLCYQLPALLRNGLTVVVSPLIALMKDQVDALTASAIPATFLNSSVPAGESRERRDGLARGVFRLLYLAPERLLMPEFLEELNHWNLASFAIDEAHCISEWGHDFRPEYRQMAVLRERFPGTPVLAVTATATPRVQEDIAKQLCLRDPRIYVGSYNRPNLVYEVSPKAGAADQIVEYLREKTKESGIVYCQSRKGAEQLAERLNRDGIPAAAYHAGLEPETRSKNQELFLRDEIRVVCATIAFGMGINKPNVRFVIHYDLPKSIESYYQETGRAGRDGLPGECWLLFNPADRVKYLRFIDEKEDPREKALARTQLDTVVHYAEDAGCRRKFLLNYFGEKFPEENCGACDNCLNPRETWDGTVAAQKFLSCVFRIQQRSGFGVGVNHVTEVLTGAETEKIERWGHQSLSTYGIGKEHSRKNWAAIGRELIRLGFLDQDAERFNVLRLTMAGMQALKSRTPVTLTRLADVAPDAKPKRKVSGEIECDGELFETLRKLRREIATERHVPPYIIFSDVSLRHMARFYPATLEEFSEMNGVGGKKLADFGEAFVRAVAGHLEAHGRRKFD
jgi:ATP-dependent DNA helicase RecQ